MKNDFKLRELLVIFHIQRIIQASGNDVQYSIASSIYKQSCENMTLIYFGRKHAMIVQTNMCDLACL